MISNLIKRIDQNPRILFLIDAFGASITAFFLGFVLVKFESFFGIPTSMLYTLAAIPVFYVIYDLYCYGKEDLRISPFLKAIAILNLVYCCLSLGLALYHNQSITIWGWIYIINEIIIIVSLSIFEFKIANNNSQKALS